MAKKEMQTWVLEQKTMNRIYVIRGNKVMLDEDLAAMYRVETRRLNEQVKRNKKRFPKDFMFTLTEREYSNLMSQNATSSLPVENPGWEEDENCPMHLRSRG